MNDVPAAHWVVAVQGIAAIATTEVEMGLSDDDVRSHVVGMFVQCGLSSREDMLAIAEEIRRAPQPLDESAEARERRSHIEDMLGVTPPEVQLAAQLRAREIVLELADRFPG